MREVKISRRKRSVGLSIKTEVFLDGQFVASVGDGETVSFEIDEEEHEIVVYNDKVSGNKINVNAGIEDVTLYLNYLFETFRLSNESDEEYAKDEFLDEKKFYNNNFTESPIKTYACAGIVTFLLVLFSLIMYLNENTTLIRFLISLVFSSAFCITMIVAGFWFIIIPLPFIYVLKAGCAKSKQSNFRKFGFGFLAFISVLLVFCSLFV